MGKLYRSEVLRVAKSLVGYKEKASNKDLFDFDANAGSGNWTMMALVLYMAGYYGGHNKNGFDYCAITVDYCLYMAAGEDAERAQAAVYYTGPYGAGCTASVSYYKAAGKIYTGTPRPGDQIFFQRGGEIVHTGLVVEVKGGNVYTIEGNADNMVKERSYSLSSPSIYGYGAPDYDGDEPPAEQTEPSPAPGTPFLDVPANSGALTAIRYCYEQGLLKGTSETTFEPNAPFTRAQAAIVIRRLAQWLSKQIR